MKACQIYINNKQIYVICLLKTIPGFWISSEPMFKTDQLISPDELGQIVLKILDNSQQEIPLPNNLKSITKIVLKFVGFKSWKTLEKACNYYRIHFNNIEIEIIPTIISPTGGYEDCLDRVIKCSSDPKEIGKILLDLI